MATEPVNEATELRAQPEIRRSVIIYRRTYRLPKGTSLPNKGDALDLAGVSGTGLLGPYVRNIHIAQQKGGGLDAVTITYDKVRPYA